VFASDTPPYTAERMAKIIEQAFLEIQGASNLSGVVHWWSNNLTYIRRHAELMGIAPNNHPVNIAIANKIVSLAGDDVYSSFKFGRDLLDDDGKVIIEKLKKLTGE